LWALIEPLLPPRKAHPLGCDRPRVDDRKAIDAILFVLRTGCQWNALNHTVLCSSSAAHRRFQEWAAAGVFLQLWTRGLAEYDALQGIDWEWLAIDGAMTKAPLGGIKVGKHPTDRAKIPRVLGGVLTDGGVLLGMAVAGANRHDFKMTQNQCEYPNRAPQPTPDRPQGMCLDKDYDFDEVRDVLAEFGCTAHNRARCEEAVALKHEAGYKARRWVVERTHSWMNRFRRVLSR
jgi:putative transposase